MKMRLGTLLHPALPTEQAVLRRAATAAVSPEEAAATATLVRLLRTLRAADRGRRVHGAATHRYRLDPPLGEAALARFEAENGVALPRDYRAFLALAGSAGAGPGYGLFPLPGPAPATGKLAQPFPGVDTLDNETDEAFEASRQGVLILGTEGCDMNYFLVVTGRARGQVWFDPDAPDALMRRIAPSFAAFMTDWAEEKIDTLASAPLVRRARRGMTVADLEALFGRKADTGAWQTMPHPDGSTGYACLPRVPALFSLDAAGQVVSIHPRKVF